MEDFKYQIDDTINVDYNGNGSVIIRCKIINRELVDTKYYTVQTLENYSIPDGHRIISGKIFAMVIEKHISTIKNQTNTQQDRSKTLNAQDYFRSKMWA